MKKWYAACTDRDTGRQIEIGAYSEKALRKDLRQMEKQGIVNSNWIFNIYTVEEGPSHESN